MDIQLKELVDVGLLNLEWVGVSGESEFQNGDKKISRWKFLKTDNSDEGCYSPEDHVFVTESEDSKGSIWKIRNKYGTTCIIKIFNWW